MGLHRLEHFMFQAVFLALLVPLSSFADPSPTMGQAAHVKVLASSCAACHGTGGNSLGSLPSLAGLDPDYFTKQMLRFKSGERTSTVMHHHAKGLTEEEIAQLASHFSRQPRRPAVQPPPR